MRVGSDKGVNEEYEEDIGRGLDQTWELMESVRKTLGEGWIRQEFEKRKQNINSTNDDHQVASHNYQQNVHLYNHINWEYCIPYST